MIKDKMNKWQGSAESIDYQPGKGMFVLMLVVAVVCAALVGFFFWYVPTVGLVNIHPALPWVLGITLLVTGTIALGGAIVITAAVVNGRVRFYSKWLHWLLVRLYLPLMVMAGGILRIPKIKIEQVFIDLNNQFVRAMGRKFRPDKILILMPHCIQFDDCKIKVTRNVRNCVGCGKCEVGELVSLIDEFGLDLFISTGGTVARRKVVEFRPDAVIAVACERDLTSGVQDAYPLPVMAIVNKRPQGYCMQTGVAMDEVRKAIHDLVA